MAVFNDEEQKKSPNFLGPSLFMAGAYLFTHNKRGEKLREYEYYLTNNIHARNVEVSRAKERQSLDNFVKELSGDFGAVVVQEHSQKETGVNTFFDKDPFSREGAEYTAHFDALNEVLDLYKETYLPEVTSENQLEAIKALKGKLNTPSVTDQYISNESVFKLYKKINEGLETGVSNMTERQQDTLRLAGLHPEVSKFQTEWEATMKMKFGATDAVRTESGLMLKIHDRYVRVPSKIGENTYTYEGKQFFVESSGATANSFSNQIDSAVANRRSFYMPNKVNLVVGGTVIHDPNDSGLALNPYAKSSAAARQIQQSRSRFNNTFGVQRYENTINVFDYMSNPDTDLNAILQSKSSAKDGVVKLSVQNESIGLSYGIDGNDSFQRHNQAHTFSSSLYVPENLRPKEYIKGVQAAVTPLSDDLVPMLRAEQRRFNENRFNGFFLVTYDSNPVADGQGSRIKGTYENTGIMYHDNDALKSGDHIKLSSSSFKTTISGEIEKTNLGIANTDLIDPAGKPAFFINGTTKQTSYGRTEKGVELMRALSEYESKVGKISDAKKELLAIGIDEQRVSDIFETYEKFKNIAHIDHNTGQVVPNGPASIHKFEQINATLKTSGSNLADTMNDSLKKHMTLLQKENAPKDEFAAALMSKTQIENELSNDNFFLKRLFAVSSETGQIVGHALNSAVGLMEHSTDYFNFGKDNIERYAYFAVSDSTRLQLQQYSSKREYTGILSDGTEGKVNLKPANVRKWEFVSGMTNPDLGRDIVEGKVSGMNLYSKEGHIYHPKEIPGGPMVDISYDSINSSTRDLMLITDISKIDTNELSIDNVKRELMDKYGYTLTEMDETVIKAYVDTPSKRFNMINERYVSWTKSLEESGFIRRDRESFKLNFLDVKSNTKYLSTTALDLTDMAKALPLTIGKNRMIYGDNFREQLDLFYNVMNNTRGVQNTIAYTFNSYVSTVFGSKNGLVSNTPDLVGMNSKISEARNFLSDYKANFKAMAKSLEFESSLVDSITLDAVDAFHETLGINDLVMHSGQDKRTKLEKKTTQVLAYRSPFINQDSADLVGLKVLSDDKVVDEFIHRVKDNMFQDDYDDLVHKVYDKKYSVRDKILKRYENKLARIANKENAFGDILNEIRTRMHEEFTNDPKTNIKKSSTTRFSEVAKKVLEERKSEIPLEKLEREFANPYVKFDMVINPETKKPSFVLNMEDAKRMASYEYLYRMADYETQDSDKLLKKMMEDELAHDNKLTHIGLTENAIASADFDGDQIKVFFIENRKLEVDNIVNKIYNLAPSNDPNIDNIRSEMRRLVADIRKALNSDELNELVDVPEKLEKIKSFIEMDKELSGDSEIADSLLFKMDSSSDAVNYYKKLYDAGKETIEEANITQLKTSMVTNITVDNNGKTIAVPINKSVRGKGSFITTRDNLEKVDISSLSQKEMKMLSLEMLMNEDELETQDFYRVKQAIKNESNYANDPKKAIKKINSAEELTINMWDVDNQEYVETKTTRTQFDKRKEELISKRESTRRQVEKLEKKAAKGDISDGRREKLESLREQLNRQSTDVDKYIAGERANTMAIISAGATMQRSLPEYYKGNVIMQNAFAYFRNEFTQQLGEVESHAFMNYIAYQTQEGLDVKKADSKKIVLDFSHDYSKTLETMNTTRDAAKRTTAVSKVMGSSFEANVVEIVNYINAESQIIEQTDEFAAKQKAFIQAITHDAENKGEARKTISKEALKRVVEDDKTGFTELVLKRKGDRLITIKDMVSEEILTAFDDSREKNFTNYLKEIYETTRGLSGTEAGQLAEDTAKRTEKNVDTLYTRLMRGHERQLREVFNNTISIYATNPTLSVSDMLEQKGTIFAELRNKTGSVLKAQDVIFMSSLNKVSKEFAEGGVIAGQIGSKKFKINSPLTMVGLGAVAAFSFMNTNNNPTKSGAMSSRNFAKNIDKVYEDKLHETQYQLYEQTRENPIVM